jgi:hypothetical protein
MGEGESRKSHRHQVGRGMAGGGPATDPVPDLDQVDPQGFGNILKREVEIITRRAE